MSEQYPKFGKIVSLDEFRERLRSSYESESTPQKTIGEKLVDKQYNFVEYPEYASYKYVIDKLEPEISKRSRHIIVATRDTDVQCVPSVFLSSDNMDRYFAVDRGINEMEALTIELSTEEPISREMAKDLKVFYTGALIGKSLINGGRDIDFTKAYQLLEMPYVGLSPIRLEFDKRFMDITKWRIAGGLALSSLRLGVDKRQVYEDFLQNQLETRLQYEISRQHFFDLVGVKMYQDDIAISDRMLGICNPLSRMQIQSLKSAGDDKQWLPLI